MKIDKNCKIENIVSKDSKRGPITRLYVHKNSSGQEVAVATDGRRLAVVPILFEEGDSEGYLTADQLKMARKVTDKKQEEISLSANGEIKLSNGVTMPRVSLDAGPYPNYPQVIPNQPATFTIGLNAHFLSELADAIGSPHGEVTLQFIDDMTAIRVSGGIQGAFGVLMPCRIK